MLTNIGRILLVTLLTALIWAWAEGEGLTTLPAAPRIAFVSPPEGDVTARVVEPGWSGVVGFSMRGSTAAVNAAQKAMLGTLDLAPGIGSFPATVGEHTLELREVLADLPQLRRAGVSIVNVEPATVKVRIERLVTRQAAIRPRFVGGELAEQPVLYPATVTLRLLEGVSDRLPAELEIPAVVDLSTLSPTPDGSPIEMRIPVRIPTTLRDAVVGEANPTSVAVSVKLGTPVETIVIPSAIVSIALDPSIENPASWTVTAIDQYIRDIRVSGPASALKPLRDGKQSLRAIVVLSKSDLVEGERTIPAVVLTGVEGLRVLGAGPIGTNGDSGLGVRIRVAKK